jgi:DNA-binding SARP family transcriptional activator/tetratricopeptide (TPR) repeat protein
MQIRVLGPLQVVDGDREITVPAGRLRVLLAALVCNANRVVSVSELISYLWDEPGPGAPDTVRSYVRRLRACLRQLDPNREFIRLRSPGYVLVVEDDEVDLLTFRARVAAAHDLADPAEAAESLRSALSLWRGAPLADVRSDALTRAVVASLEEEHTRAVEQRIDRELAAGEHGALVGELTALVEKHPLRERLWGQLMLALARSGRQAEALAAHRRLRAVLADDLGVDPGPEVQRIHAAILRGEDEAIGAPEVPGDAPVPRQLVADCVGFVGRAAMVDELTRWLTTTRGRRLLVLSGQPGVGKTALAVRLAHRVAERFPDGQVFVDLHGFSGSSVVEPGEVLARVLKDLGVPAARLPEGVDAKGALLRATLRGRRVLFLLDDAVSAEQVRPLLPGGDDCAVIVTARYALSGLVAFDEARGVRVPPLSTADSTTLLSRLLTGRGDSSDDLRRLAHACAHVPSALRLAATYLASRRHVPVSVLLDSLREQGPEPLAVPGDERASVFGAFARSLARLSDPTRQALLATSVLPGPAVTVQAVAALVDCDGGTAARIVAEWEEAGLAESVGPHRYRLFDLVWACGLRFGERELPGSVRADAAKRLTEHYVQTALRASKFVRRAPLPLGLPAHSDRTPTVRFDGLHDALSWYEAERENLVAVVRECERRGWHHYASALPVVLCTFYVLRKHWTDWEQTHEVALRAARRGRDRRAESTVLHRIAALHNSRGEYDAALRANRTAVAIGEELDDPRLVATALTGLGSTYRALGEFERAKRCYERSLRLSTEAGDPYGRIGPLVNTTRLRRQRGEFDRAIACGREAIKVAVEYGSSSHPAVAWLDLGEVHLAAGQRDEAVTALREAVRLATDAGDVVTQARARELLASGTSPLLDAVE